MSSFTPITKVITSTDGVIIYSDAIGDPTKPSVVFIHGISLSGACFDNLFADKSLLDKFYLVPRLVFVTTKVTDVVLQGAIRLAWTWKEWKAHYSRRLHVLSFRR